MRTDAKKREEAQEKCQLTQNISIAPKSSFPDDRHKDVEIGENSK